jgi:uncharacterized ferritin-like protein (DUF455 family)
VGGAVSLSDVIVMDTDMDARNRPASGLAAAAVAVLSTALPDDKVRRTRGMAEAWRSGELVGIGSAAPPSRPARPATPELRAPRDMPRRGKGGTPAGRIALLHALAHIELNAIDLACDIIARFTEDDLPRAFYDDWVTVADDEAKHFGLLGERLAAHDASYGDLPAHDGLWQAAEETAGDILARLAVVPLLLEARGLDVTPAIIANLGRAGDEASAAALETIYREEIGHVASGRKWFEHVCRARGLAPVATYHSLVRKHYRGRLKPPFNTEARNLAGFGSQYYEPLAPPPTSSPADRAPSPGRAE